jgi:hypothetical protein
MGDMISNQHLELLSYERSPNAKTNSGSRSMIFCTVSIVLDVQPQSPAAPKLKSPKVTADVEE